MNRLALSSTILQCSSLSPMVTFCIFFKDDQEQNFANFSTKYPEQQLTNLAKKMSRTKICNVRRNPNDVGREKNELDPQFAREMIPNDNLKNLQSMTRNNNIQDMAMMIISPNFNNSILCRF